MKGRFFFLEASSSHPCLFFPFYLLRVRAEWQRKDKGVFWGRGGKGFGRRRRKGVDGIGFVDLGVLEEEGLQTSSLFGFRLGSVGLDETQMAYLVFLLYSRFLFSSLLHLQLNISGFRVTFLVGVLCLLLCLQHV